MKRAEHYMSATDKSFRIKFGKHIASKFGSSIKKIKYLSNSANYPNSIALTSTDLISGEIFGIIRKDNNGNIIDTYVLNISELIIAMDLYQADSKKLVTYYNQDPEDKGVLVRIPYSYFESYKEAI